MCSSHGSDLEASSSSEDDEDYVPSDEGEEEIDKECEEPGSCDEETLSNSAADKKRDLCSAKRDSAASEKDDEESRRRRADALFEAFLADTEQPTTSRTASFIEPKKPHVKVFKEESAVKRRLEVTDPFAEEDIFGEADERKAAVGLDSALSLASKKSKMSLLDKSQKDWTDFKAEEGIEEDLTTHNRGRNGYLDKMDFLTRADFRQFVNERDARALQRNKRF